MSSSTFYAFGAVVDHVARGGRLDKASLVYQKEFEAQEARDMMLLDDDDDSATLGSRGTYYSNDDVSEDDSAVSTVAASKKTAEKRENNDSHSHHRQQEEEEDARDDVDSNEVMNMNMRGNGENKNNNVMMDRDSLPTIAEENDNDAVETVEEEDHSNDNIMKKPTLVKYKPLKKVKTDLVDKTPVDTTEKTLDSNNNNNKQPTQVIAAASGKPPLAPRRKNFLGRFWKHHHHNNKNKSNKMKTSSSSSTTLETVDDPSITIQSQQYQSLLGSVTQQQRSTIIAGGDSVATTVMTLPTALNNVTVRQGLQPTQLQEDGGIELLATSSNMSSLGQGSAWVTDSDCSSTETGLSSDYTEESDESSDETTSLDDDDDTATFITGYYTYNEDDKEDLESTGNGFSLGGFKFGKHLWPATVAATAANPQTWFEREGDDKADVSLHTDDDIEEESHEGNDEEEDITATNVPLKKSITAKSIKSRKSLFKYPLAKDVDEYTLATAMLLTPSTLQDVDDGIRIQRAPSRLRPVLKLPEPPSPDDEDSVCHSQQGFEIVANSQSNKKTAAKSVADDTKKATDPPSMSNPPHKRNLKLPTEQESVCRTRPAKSTTAKSAATKDKKTTGDKFIAPSPSKRVLKLPPVAESVCSKDKGFETVANPRNFTFDGGVQNPNALNDTDKAAVAFANDHSGGLSTTEDKSVTKKDPPTVTSSPSLVKAPMYTRVTSDNSKSSLWASLTKTRSTNKNEEEQSKSPYDNLVIEMKESLCVSEATGRCVGIKNKNVDDGVSRDVAPTEKDVVDDNSVVDSVKTGGLYGTPLACGCYDSTPTEDETTDDPPTNVSVAEEPTIVVDDVETVKKDGFNAGGLYGNPFVCGCYDSMPSNAKITDNSVVKEPADIVKDVEFLKDNGIVVKDKEGKDVSAPLFACACNNDTTVENGNRKIEFPDLRAVSFLDEDIAPIRKKMLWTSLLSDVFFLNISQPKPRFQKEPDVIIPGAQIEMVLNEAVLRRKKSKNTKKKTNQKKTKARMRAQQRRQAQRVSSSKRTTHPNSKSMERQRAVMSGSSRVVAYERRLPRQGSRGPKALSKPPTTKTQHKAPRQGLWEKKSSKTSNQVAQSMLPFVQSGDSMLPLVGSRD